MRPTSFHPFRSLIAWDRNPWLALFLRVGVVALCLRPWATRIMHVDFHPEELDPKIVEAVRTAGVDPFSPTAWPTPLSAGLRALSAGLLFALLWWGVSRLKRLAMARRGPGLVAALVPLGAYVGLILGARSVLTPLMVPGSYLLTAIPVWQGWVFHPLIHPSRMEDFLLLLGLLSFVGLELLLLVAEGRHLLTEAREGALRARLSPHFLYNTLNTLEAQIEDDPRGALDTTQRLSALFEQVQKVTDRPTVPLRDELALVEDMLALERRRLGERLRLSIEVPEELLDRELPVLGLQVLVENAIRHAIAPRVEGGTLQIRVEAEGQGLRVSVEDSGDGTSRGKNGTGQALANLRARLRRPSDFVLERCELGFRAAFRWS